MHFYPGLTSEAFFRLTIRQLQGLKDYMKGSCGQ